MNCPDCLKYDGARIKLNLVDGLDALYMTHADRVYQCHVCYYEEEKDTQPDDETDGIEKEGFDAF